MEAKELRIGNFISDKNASDSFFAKVKKLDYSRCYYGQFHSAYSDLKPIPITKAWLDRFGLTYEGFYKAEPLTIVPIGDVCYPNGRVFVNRQDLLINQPKYIHELQNLFFAITGEELELKEVV